MARLYKLTLDSPPAYLGDPGPPKPMTRDCTIWGPGATHRAKYLRGEKPRLCTHTVIHAYRHPVQAAVSMNSHGMGKATQLWEARGVVVVEDPFKLGCRQLTTVRPTAWYEPSPQLQALVSLALHATSFPSVAGVLNDAFHRIAQGVRAGEVFREGSPDVRHALFGLMAGHTTLLPSINPTDALRAYERAHEVLKHTMIQP